MVGGGLGVANFDNSTDTLPVPATVNRPGKGNSLLESAALTLSILSSFGDEL